MQRVSPSVFPARADRRRWLAALAALPLAGAVPAWAQQATSACLAVLDWTSFVARHIQPDGRVLDFDTPRQPSTSEGQSHALFFSLVHDDRATFDRVLAWTDSKLAAGSLGTRLPACRWGRNAEGAWSVLDDSPAPGADLWLAYALLEAGRLWHMPRYQALGRALLALAARDEVVALPGLGRMLLPGPRATAQGPLWRLNPSDLPLQLLRRFQQQDGPGPWGEIADHTVRMLGATTPRGFAPDGCAWSARDQAFAADPEKRNVGGYQAIRVYLWAGMLHANDPARAPLLESLYGPRRLLEQQEPVPAYVDTETGTGRGTGPVGYAGALLPYLKAQGLSALLETQLARIRARVASRAEPAAAPLPHHERMLLLFGQGWLDGRFAFGRSGQLQTHWQLLCPSTQLA